MANDDLKLRKPARLEALFYQELLAPLRHFLHSSGEDPDVNRAARMMSQRFKKDIARYGYVITDLGVMMQVEQDIVYHLLDPADQAKVETDMQILRRLRFDL